MSSDRTINLNIPDDGLLKLAESIKSWEKLWTAIGYLSSWNLSFPRVDIYQGTDDDLIGVYFDGNNVRGYVICAVWHEDHYGFHS